VALNRAEYRDRIEWKSWLLKVRRAKAAALGRKGPFDDMNLSIGVYGGDGIIIDNNVARADLEIDIVLRGTVRDPRLIGRIASTEGKFYFRNSEFDIVRATADFSDVSYAEPYVDVVAETTAKGYHVWLNLEGRPDQLDMALASDPDLGEEEILSLITVGAFGERLQGLESGIGAAEASSALTGGFQDVVEERIRDLTGVSRFTIDPYVSRKTGSITPRVTVAKRLAGENIFVTFSSTMSTSEEQEIKLEYRINRNVSLIGGQDDLGTLGGDVRFRFYFK
ncbi:MAG: translocation/assembly module TamB domain-containing protein, partial [Nitrospirota bacterium]